MTSKGILWIPARINIDEQYIRVTSDEGSEEFKPNRLAWRKTDEFLLSGLNPRALLKQSILRFRSEDEAKRVASLILRTGLVKEEPLVQVEEIPVEIIATVLVGRLFLALIIFFLALFASAFLPIPATVGWIFDLLILILFFTILIRIVDRQMKAGPAAAWFRPRTVKAWLIIDNDLLTIKTLNGAEGYIPTRIEWKNPNSFVVSDGETNLQLSFRDSSTAVDVADRVKSSFPEIQEESSSRLLEE